MEEEKKASDQEDRRQEGSRNPFEPSRFRITTDYRDLVKTERKVLTIPVGKPTKFDWIRTHMDLELWFDTQVLFLPETRDPYLLDPALWDSYTKESRTVRLVPTSTRQGSFFLWALNLKSNSWNDSAIAAAEEAREKWVRVVSNQGMRAYETITAKIEIPAPKFPHLDLCQILELAFRDRLIESWDHPVLKSLRGEN